MSAAAADGVAPSGKILMRVPSSLHGQLLAEADREGVSLNQFCAAALAAAVSWRVPEPAPARPRRSTRAAVPGRS